MCTKWNLFKIKHQIQSRIINALMPYNKDNLLFPNMAKTTQSRYYRFTQTYEKQVGSLGTKKQKMQTDLIKRYFVD